MSKANVFAIAAALIVAGVAGWLALTPNPSVAGPIGIRVHPSQMTVNTTDLPTERYHDFSLVFD